MNAVKSSLTKEVSPWLSLSVKCPRPAAISAVAPTGSCPLPALRFAPSAVSPSCPTELARLAVPTMAVRSWLSRLSNQQRKCKRKASAFLFFLCGESPLTMRIRCAVYRYFPDPPGFVPAVEVSPLSFAASRRRQCAFGASLFVTSLPRLFFSIIPAFSPESHILFPRLVFKINK